MNLLDIDEVWMVPCGTRKDKPSLTTSPEMRLQMVELAIKDFFPPDYPIKTSDIEVKNGETI